MSSPLLPLTWHLARRSGRRGLQSHLLAAGAAAVSALVLLVLLAAWSGAGTRADRTDWRTPQPDRNGTAVQTLSTTFVRGEPVTVVDLAQLPGRKATPAPPGVAAFPEPGQVYLSPALAELVHGLPRNQLADRFPEPREYGTVGAAGLAAPGELLAVIGRAPSDPAVSGAAGQPVMDSGLADRAVVSGFSGTAPSVFTAQDRSTVLIGIGLLVVPVIVLASAAGRLGAARREQRLAALRLAGATPRQILAMTGAEAAAVGAVGAATGALAYAALLPALAGLPFGIGTWFTADLWVGVAGAAAVVAGVASLTALSAVSALREVVRSPLGVAQQSDPRRTRMIRLVLFAGLVLYVVVTARDGGLKISQQVALLILFYGAFWIVGPWATDRIGRVLGRFARRPATLLAARRLSDDPRGAWRTVSGLVLAGFVAGFFSVAHLSFDTFEHPDQVAVAAPDGAHGRAAVRQSADRARELLKDAGVPATVQALTGARSDESLLLGGPGVLVRISGSDPARLDAATTALAPLNPASPPYTDKSLTAVDDLVQDQLRGLSLASMAVSFVVATASAGLTAAANVLDRRRVYGLLRLAGTPLRVLDRARVRETVVPLVLLAGTMTGCGVYAAVKLNEAGGTTLDATGALQLGLCALLGAAAMFTAIGASRPLLRAVTDNPSQQPD
ncbi:ABC transporter permease [Streptomyces sp. BV286]|uniref:FtsX-like permease family protein n=1 Tax=Streptomyces sp. BV286 TaxID=2849672 RepID=UPI001C2E60F1|nr:FtsX-like permease family protein [Streptomyces sp. BV286]MBV1938229.1 ABC transporter permease [Streptomyces sp. BV286]